MIRIALDIDDTILDFLGFYKQYFSRDIDMVSKNITKNVYKLRNNKTFWENLPLLERPIGFEPCIYSTKRINSKVYTRNCLSKYGLPIKPIYQTICQLSNKADIIKGRCDVLIDDSIFNVKKAIKAGLPALLISRPHNININFEFRIDKLDYREIEKMYNYEKCVLQIQSLYQQQRPYNF